MATDCITKINTATARSLLPEDNTCIVDGGAPNGAGEECTRTEDWAGEMLHFLFSMLAFFFNKLKMETCKLIKSNICRLFDKRRDARI